MMLKQMQDSNIITINHCQLSSTKKSPSDSKAKACLSPPPPLLPNPASYWQMTMALLPCSVSFDVCGSHTPGTTALLIQLGEFLSCMCHHFWQTIHKTEEKKIQILTVIVSKCLHTNVVLKDFLHSFFKGKGACLGIGCCLYHINKVQLPQRE